MTNYTLMFMLANNRGKITLHKIGQNFHLIPTKLQFEIISKCSWITFPWKFTVNIPPMCKISAINMFGRSDLKINWKLLSTREKPNWCTSSSESKGGKWQGGKHSIRLQLLCKGVDEFKKKTPHTCFCFPARTPFCSSRSSSAVFCAMEVVVSVEESLLKGTQRGWGKI